MRDKRTYKAVMTAGIWIDAIISVLVALLWQSLAVGFIFFALGCAVVCTLATWAGR